LATKAKRPLNESGLEVGYMKFGCGDIPVEMKDDSAASIKFSSN
jgi:hypothetical protein